METRTGQAQRIIDAIQAEGGRIRLEDGMLLCGPKGVALSYAAEITEFKPELMVLLTPRPILVPVPARPPLELIREGVCPKCGDTLTFQSRDYGCIHWCGACRVFFKESDYE